MRQIADYLAVGVDNVAVGREEAIDGPANYPIGSLPMKRPLSPQPAGGSRLFAAGDHGLPYPYSTWPGNCSQTMAFN